jgi:hypothetical protein
MGWVNGTLNVAVIGNSEMGRRRDSLRGVARISSGIVREGERCRKRVTACIESDASIKVTSRKNITSIIGMISMQPRR